MEREALYMDFVDGIIDKESEEEFAKLFASDESFRRGFKAYLKLIQTINKNTKGFGPTVEETNQLFSRLGILPPVYAVPSAGTKAKTGKYYSFSKYFVTAIIASLLTFLLMYNSYDSIIENSETIAKIYASNPKLIVMESPETAINQKDSELSKMESIQHFAKNQSKLASEEVSNYDSDELANPVNTKTIHIKIDKSTIDNSFLSDDDLMKQDERIFYKNEIENLINLEEFEKINTEMTNNFIIELKNTPTITSKEVKVNPESLNEFNNIDLSLNYAISSNFEVGLNIRQETFYLEYNGTDDFKGEYIIIQHPNILSYGLITRYKPLMITQNIAPIMQLSFNASKSGIITRELVGFEYLPIDNFYFMFGAEFSQFIFQHQNVINNSSKISINFGLGVKL